MALPKTRGSQTLQDYGTPGSGSGAEKSNWQFWTRDMSAANFVALTGEMSALRTATLDLVLGSEAGSTNLAASSTTAIENTDPLAQRENKWLVRYHDGHGKRFTLEIPTAKLVLLDTGTEFLDLTVTVVATWVTAFETTAVSPDDSGSSVVVDSIQFVGRRN